MIADELRRQADHFIELVDLQAAIGRSGDRPQRPQRDDYRVNPAEGDDAPGAVGDDDGDDLQPIKTPGDFDNLA
jgi:hypothetical protein